METSAKARFPHASLGGNERRISEASMLAERSRSKTTDSSNESHVKVAVRCRPISEKEIKDGHQSIIELEGDRRIVVHNVNEAPSEHLGTASGERKNFSHIYDFDTVFGPHSKQAEVYDSVCRPIVESVLQGYNGTIFAYGQTGTGKTYTMEGVNRRRVSNTGSASKNKRNSLVQSNENGAKEFGNNAQSSSGEEINSNQPIKRDSQAGVIPRTFEQIFDYVASNPSIQFLIRASYLEIYQEEIRDLLRKDKNARLELHERPDIGVYVKDITSFVCKSIAEIERVMRVGNQNRMVAATDMNEHSSRSHAIFMITVEQQTNSGMQRADLPLDGKPLVAKLNGKTIKVGKLNLVDLAGSERQRKTNSLGQRQQESIKINLSLSALGNVINSLMKLHIHEQKQQSFKSSAERPASHSQAIIHTPYRDSKLTRLLQDSLGGNAKTLMIANIGPASYNYDETINTLNYASRARCIRNKPRLNEDPKDALLRELQREIDLLRSKLSSFNSDANGDSSSNNNNGNIAGIRVDSKSSNGSDTGGSKADRDGNKRLIREELLGLKQKLASLERKLLNGDQSGSSLDPNTLEGYTREQELELMKHKNELIDQDGRQKSIYSELEKREEAELLAKESFNSIQQEVEAKRQLIRQILLKTKSIRDEIESKQRTYRLELDELDQLQYALQKELKLKCLIMDNFIPNGHVDQLLPRIIYDDRRNCCSIEPIELALEQCTHHNDTSNYNDYWRPSGNSMRPKSEFERISETIYPNDIRYKYEELIEPKLDSPKFHKVKRRLCVLRDYEETNIDNEQTGLQRLIEDALNQREMDVEIL